MIKLSIITINYNEAEGLRKTLASVATQTYPHIQHIIVDGGSTDQSLEVIREYESSLAFCLSPLASNLKWISEKDTGIYNAMNKGIEIALGKRIVNDDHTSSSIANSQSPIAQTEYLQFLNSGDMLFAADVTERMMKALIKKQQTLSERLGVIYGNMIKDMPHGQRQLDRCNGGEDVTLNMFYRGCLNHSPAYIHKSLFEKYGLYDETLRICSDWKFYLQSLVLGGERVEYADIDMTLFDMNGISETQKDLLNAERNQLLSELIPSGILRDYELYHFPIEQYRRLKRHHLWGVVYFIERLLFKLEKWRILK